MNFKELLINKSCSACDKPFHCTTEPDCNECWCNEFPAIMPLGLSQDCLCSDCLKTAIQEQVEFLLQNNTITKAIEMARPFFQPKQLQEGIDYTIEQGNYVFSAWYHLKRGSCCGNGCKHCPYPKD